MAPLFFGYGGVSGVLSRGVSGIGASEPDGREMYASLRDAEIVVRISAGKAAELRVLR